jgi:poly-gamma-glutamate synthesis protein (capsule biosynthesis protein)
VALLPDPPESYAEDLRDRLAPMRQAGDRLLVSIHWGGNWGYDVPDWQRRLAHALIEGADADVVFGHSSHHPKAAEVHRGGLILYGSGDLLNDYEGIGGHAAYPADTALGLFVDLSATGVQCRMRPYQIRRFRLQRADDEAAARIAAIMAEQCARFATVAAPQDSGDILVAPD